jgi:hypothetical protein
LAGAAILATFTANEKAMQTNVPMYVVQDGNLYQIQSCGIKKFIRKIDKPPVKLQEHFKHKEYGCNEDEGFCRFQWIG